jgi:hypothetical protein
MLGSPLVTGLSREEGMFIDLFCVERIWLRDLVRGRVVMIMLISQEMSTLLRERESDNAGLPFEAESVSLLRTRPCFLPRSGRSFAVRKAGFLTSLLWEDRLLGKNMTFY